MDNATLKKLEAVILDRMSVQYSQEKEMLENDSKAEAHSTEELISFALEEAWQNDELEFLTADVEAIKDCSECHYQPCKKHDK